MFLLRAFALDLCSLSTAWPSSLERINFIISFGICSTPKESKYIKVFLFTYNATQ